MESLSGMLEAKKLLSSIPSSTSEPESKVTREDSVSSSDSEDEDEVLGSSKAPSSEGVAEDEIEKAVRDKKKKKKLKEMKRKKKMQETKVSTDDSEHIRRAMEVLHSLTALAKPEKVAPAPEVKKRNTYKGPTFAGVSAKTFGYKMMPRVGTDKWKLVKARLRLEKDKYEAEFPTKSKKKAAPAEISVQ
jgi:hypothetical protein